MPDTAPAALPPFRPVDLAAPSVEVERRDDGVIVLRSGYELGEYPAHILEHLARWAGEAPDRTFMAQRGPDGTWRHLTYADLWAKARHAGQALLDLGLGPDRPLMLLSGNSLEHAVLTFAGMAAGVPAAPVSPAYSLLSGDHGKLKYVHDLLQPGAIFVQDRAPFEKALAALPLGDEPVISVADGYAELLATEPGAGIAAAYAALDPDTVAKYLFTSGSTGMPKAVINTQRMLAANVAMAMRVAPPDPEDPPVIVDWLPWNHTFGGNMNVHVMLAAGGTMYLDGGRPVPGQFDETLRNLREISATSYLNVPVGYAMLADALERDDDLAGTFFKRLQRMGYGGATLPQELYERYQKLAIKHTGHRIIVYTGWGCTETAPTATSVYWASERVGLIGLPYPGVELKMVPAGERYELRLRGPIVFPGYYKRPDLTEAAFDEEGFYRIGDAGKFVDPADPVKGLTFEGRVTEDFKLTSGTWVNTGPLRIAVIDAATPLLQDAVICGHDRDYVAVMAWPSAAGAELGDGLADTLRDRLGAYNQRNPGSSTRIRRLLLLSEPPSVD